ncbi:hypothetical protein [Bacteroides sp.]|uniref:hypothetical protein n=1 Tax=Bacteroides sp. TaxID=29523 RepID=UPI002A8318DF|nr:hypothetical protein [Bacteroides sp.]
MKEYVAETGGRYTYADDILNLQELALSMTAIFTDCSNFIISGCEVSGSEIAPGYVWINGRVRFFSGCKNATWPYYIYEQNSNETVTYANEVNKRGRSLYLSAGGEAVPDVADPITGQLPQFIEMTSGYSPRFIDKFFGKYAVLADSPFAKQTVKKDLILTGNFSADKNIESKTAVSVVNPGNGYSLRNIVKANGDVATGAYLNGLLVNEIVIGTDGSFSFIKQGKELARVTESGISYTHLSGITSKAGAIYISGASLTNYDDATDNGSVDINATGVAGGSTKFRNFNVYDGKQAVQPLFQVNGKERAIYANGKLSIRNTGSGVVLANTAYLKDNMLLTNNYVWADSKGEIIGSIGYSDTESFDFSVHNQLGNIVLTAKGYVNIAGTLKIGGVNISDIYVSQKSFTEELKKKVAVVAGKQLSTEDFTTDYKKKLEAISGGSIESAGDGFVTARDVAAALKLKLTISENLADLANKGTARNNLDVYSKGEANGRFLKISEKLLELVSLTADEVNGLTAEQAAALKAQKQEAVRANLDAEKKGTGELKLNKASNLNDLADKIAARKNISVYSTTEIDKLLEKKLNADAAYDGVSFTEEMRQKLENIKGGNFAYIDTEGVSHAQVEGFVTSSQVVKELNKKANLLLDGYNESQKNTIAANINVYSKTVADGKFASVESLFQDYITYLVKQGKNTSEAQKTLRDKLDVLSKSDVTGTYLRKDGKLSDLSLPNADARKQACRSLGAAYAEEYEPKLIDTGWMQMSNSGSATDTRSLFIRQIGNIVCIQGVINTGRRDGTNWGGVVAVIPNKIPAPKYGLRTTLCDFNDDHKYNRGSSFVIPENSRNIHLYESGWEYAITNINFTYMI